MKTIYSASDTAPTTRSWIGAYSGPRTASVKFGMIKAKTASVPSTASVAEAPST